MAKDPKTGLTPKQEKFCLEYVSNGGNATAAYKEAYVCGDMKEATIGNNAYKLLQHNDVITKIAAIQKKAAAPIVKKFSITLENQSEVILAALERIKIIATQADTDSKRDLELKATESLIDGTKKLLELNGLNKKVAQDLNIKTDFELTPKRNTILEGIRSRLKSDK